jgi:ATP synthase protein I
VQKTAVIQVRRGIQLQLLLLSCMLGLLLVVDRTIAVSALTGGFIATSAHIWFAWRALAGEVTEAGQILGMVYRAEVGKIVLTVMLFSAAFVMIKPMSVVSLMAAYLITTWIPWLASYYWSDDSKPGDIKNVR